MLGASKDTGIPQHGAPIPENQSIEDRTSKAFHHQSKAPARPAKALHPPARFKDRFRRGYRARALQPVAVPEILSPVLPKPVEDAFVDYSRLLTPDGGILISYKDYDIRWRHTIWRVFAWCVVTGYEAWFVNRRPRLPPPSLGRSIAWLADRRRDPTPINRIARADPADEHAEFALGCAAHPRRTAQARV
jgi:hypothetical protein